ncbi:DUF3703 domain-containing protein [Massilia sp. BSC265]|uniref:DUF3703 domain-containing protein n=1 Tax=Massilia sp. BSC265 TaxID=1549812 RepID=UPI0004E944AD|nr:DUF3703 domain-containing protein [Massilia sp. BSC265]KFI07648.1 hypothetical protein JN27_08735 [Massilia sp. BSC265]
MPGDLRRQAFDAEMAAAGRLYRDGLLIQAFRHLETAHVLGQRQLVPHVLAHYWMLKIGLKRRSVPEVWGQLVRIVLGALGSAVGIVPTGNTGGTDIGMFKRLPIAPAIRRLIGE